MVSGFTYLCLTCLLTSTAAAQTINTSTKIKKEVDDYLSKAIVQYNIPGIALAVIKDGNIIYESYRGKASLENDTPVSKETLFRVFSTTKLITTVALFQLVQADRLSLEDPISLYLNGLPNQWQNVRIKHLLAHSSGLPDFIRQPSSLSDKELMSRLSQEKMDFVPGKQFRYNQTNYWLIAQIIEEITGGSFQDYVFQHQFNDQKNGVLFSSNASDSIPNRATRYFYNGRNKAFEKDNNNNGKRGHPGNGLNITLKRFIEWNRLLDKGELLNYTVRASMWAPFDFANKEDQFLHGWGLYKVNGHDSYGFSGGNLSGFRKFVDQHTTIIFLSNGYQLPAYDIIINDIARLVIPEISARKVILESEILSNVQKGQFEKALTVYSKAKKENPESSFDNIKFNINDIGNHHLYVEKDIKKAFQVFQFNVEANRGWWISAASLAEMYELQQDTAMAISTYEKAISLNDKNQWDYNEQMKQAIKKLTSN